MVVTRQDHNAYVFNLEINSLPLAVVPLLLLSYDIVAVSGRAEKGP